MFGVTTPCVTAIVEALKSEHECLVFHATGSGGRASDSIGCVRSFYLQDGGHLREQLLALNDPKHTFTYNILKSPMPVKNYVATLRLMPITVGNETLAEWWADFDVTLGTDDEMITHIGDNVFVGGFAALNAKLKK